MADAAATPAADVLIVQIDGRTYALPLAQVLDVCRSLPVTVLPGAPAHILGMAAWRGQVIPCVALHHLGLGGGRMVPKQFLIVVLRLPHGVVGLEVEGPVEVMARIPETAADGAMPDVQAWAWKTVTPLAPEQLLPAYQGPSQPPGPS